MIGTVIRVRTFRGAHLWIALMIAAGVAIALVQRSYLALFIPAALLAIPVLGRRLLTNPLLIFTLFLLVAANLDFFKLGGGRLTLDVALSAAFMYAILVRTSLQGWKLSLGPVERVYLVYLAVGFVSVILSVSPMDSLKRWGRDVQYLVFFMFLAGQMIGEKDERRMVGAVVFSSILPCVLGLVGYLGNVDLFLGQELYFGPEGYAEARVGSTFSHPVTLSLYLAFVCPLTISLILDRRWFPRRYLLPTLALQLIVLYLTYGRTGWIGFGGALICILWLRGRRRPLLLLPVLLVAAWFLIPSFQERWETVLSSSDQENSFMWRVGLWAYALTIFPQRPIFGSGLGTFLEHVNYLGGYGPHQPWIGLLVETGIVGVLAFLITMIVLGRALWSQYRRSDPIRKPIVEGVLAGWSALMIGSLGANVFSLPSVVIYLWSMAGLCLRNELRGGESIVAGPAISETRDGSTR